MGQHFYIFSGSRKKKAFLDLLLEASENTENPLTLRELREEADTLMFAVNIIFAPKICVTLYSKLYKIMSLL